MFKLTELSAVAAAQPLEDAAPSPAPSSETMAVHCPKCATTHLVAEASIESVHRSADGLVGYVRCSAGHMLVHPLAEAYAKPKPPPSVIAFRDRWAAAEQAAAQ